MPRVTQTKLARELGVTQQAVSKALAAKRLECGEDGLLDLEASRARWDETSRPSITGTGSDYHAQRTMRESYLAKLARMDYEERAGRLVDATEIQAQAFNAGRRIREHLITMADRIAARVAGETDRTECYQIVLAEVERALDELAPAETVRKGAK